MPDDDDEHLDQVFTDQARQRVRLRRIFGAALTTAVVVTIALTIAGATHHSIPPYVATAPAATTTTQPPHADPTRGLLGIEVENSDPRVIGDVAGLPAERAGIAPGDVIVAIDGTRITSTSGLTIMLQHSQPHDKINVTWKDAHGQEHSATIELAALPAK